MLERLYVHNFRCLENFEFKPGEQSSALLIGKNGSGKSTIAQALTVLQRIGRGVNRVGLLVSPGDCTLGRSELPMRFELQLRLDGRVFEYVLALELPDRFKELRVLEEKLSLDGSIVYSRQQAQVTVRRNGNQQPEAQFSIDWHLVALTVIQDPATAGALGRFRQWLASMVLLAPIPKLIIGDATAETLEPKQDGSNLADWLAGLLAQYPAAYATVSHHLQQVMPDLTDFRFEREGRDAKAMQVRFTAGEAQHELSFDVLSDGEKCFFLCAVLLASNQSYGPLFAFWDEPDNYLSIDEVSQFVMSLRRSFRRGGQILMTSHNDEAIRRFSHENTWLLGRKSHLEPTVIRLLEHLPRTADVIQSLLAGDLEP